MSRNTVLFLVTLAVLLAASPVVADEGATPAGPKPLRIAEHHDRAVSVKTWDPRSLQRLFRIDGSLFQESAGLYFPVISERISVGLAEGVESWDQLVSDAIASDAKAFQSRIRSRNWPNWALALAGTSIPSRSSRSKQPSSSSN